MLINNLVDLFTKLKSIHQWTFKTLWSREKQRWKELPTANKSGIELSPLDKREITIYKSVPLNRKTKLLRPCNYHRKNTPMIKQKWSIPFKGFSLRSISQMRHEKQFSLFPFFCSDSIGFWVNRTELWNNMATYWELG